jgi:hypothetical protein
MYILSSQLWGIVSAVTIIAAISLIWFDCSSPGTCMALFRSWFGLNQIPLLQRAFAFLFSKQAPSV